MNYDILLPGQQFLGYDVLHSPNMRFNLSFFTSYPDNYHYLSIVGKMVRLWVANRDTPIKSTSGVLNISKAGYLTLYEDNQPLIIINQDQPATLYLNYTLWDHYPPGCVKPEPSSCQEADEFGFVEVPKNINLNSFSLDNPSLSFSDCKELCRKNCSCIGFHSNNYVVGCTFFPANNHDLLSSIEQYHEGNNKTILNVRRNFLPEKVTLQPKRRKRNIRKALLIGGSTIAAAAAAFFLVLMSSYLLRKRKHSFQGELHDADDDEAVMKELHAIVASNLDGDNLLAFLEELQMFPSKQDIF
ncbi:hypothetical protein ACFE04_010712 [Oxalis oulophora]